MTAYTRPRRTDLEERDQRLISFEAKEGGRYIVRKTKDDRWEIWDRVASRSMGITHWEPGAIQRARMLNARDEEG